MIRKDVPTGIAIVMAITLNVAAFGEVDDYVFEPVSVQVKKGDEVIVSVRLKHKPTDKPVSDGSLFKSASICRRMQWGKWSRH
jgi:hypothetical protein